MLPRRRLIRSLGFPPFIAATKQTIMSESSPHELCVYKEDQVDRKIFQYAKHHITKDRRWMSSQRIKFLQPSNSPLSTQLPACDTSDSILDSRSFSDDTNHPHCSTTSSSHGPKSAELDLRVAGQLPYPDLSLAFSALASDTPPLAAFPCSSVGQTSLKQTVAITASENDFTIIKLTPDEPFRSPGGFHIPKSKFENALNSRPGSAASYWQYTLYEGPGVEKQKVKLHYCKNKESTEAVSQMFLNEDVIGFDIEWMAQAKSTDGIKNNVALIQFASEERIALFHLARYPGPETVENLVAPTLKKIMESPNISKVGVAIKGDCTRLKNYLDIHCQGLFELSYLHKLVQYRSGYIHKVDRRNVRLADQVEEHLKLPLYKGDVQTSDWGRDLDYQQTQYAASDSYAGLQLFHVLEAKRKAFDPIPPRPAHAELNIAISLGEEGQYDELVEQRENEDESSDTQSVSSTDISVEKLASEYFHVSLDDASEINPKAVKQSQSLSDIAQCSQLESKLSTPEVPVKSKDGITSAEGLNSPELEIANQFVAAFRPPKNQRVAPQALRAYSLWHEQGMTIPEVAAKLRKPAIQNGTVISYLCDAICMGDLKYEPEKLLGLSSGFSWRPFCKAHRDLFDRARRRVRT